MKNERALVLVESLIVNYRNFSDKRYNKLKEHTYQAIYGKWDTKTWYDLTDLFFNLVTGEPDFQVFYSRFESPGMNSGTKPIAWDPRFLPDMINENIWDTSLELEDKVKKVEKLYQKCVKLEKEFKRKK
jgi:hypothetical protein